MICTLTRQEFLLVPVAQWIARWTSNPKVPGSNPGRDAKGFFFASERNELLLGLYHLFYEWISYVISSASFKYDQD